MDDDRSEPAGRMESSSGQGPAEAFEALRQEVKMMRRALAALVDEQRGQPDYSETLGQIAADLDKATGRISWLAKRAALTLTPEQMARQIKEAGNDVRSADRKTMFDASNALQHATRSLSGWIRTAREARDQRRRLVGMGVTAALVGVIIGWDIPMALARAAPRSSPWPERMAVRALGQEPWAAGERLMAKADPSRWQEVQTWRAIGRQNREVIQRCRKVAERTKREQQCRVKVGPYAAS